MADLGLCRLYPLLYSLARLFHKPGLGGQGILDQELELVCHNAAHNALVLDLPKMDG